MGLPALASVDDLEAVFRPMANDEERNVAMELLLKASARLRQQAPWDLDARIALFAAGTGDRMALDPVLVADVVATIVKKFLTNPDGVASSTESAGVFSRTQMFVARSDKTGADARGGLVVTDGDIQALFPPPGGSNFGSVRLGTGKVPWDLGAYGTPVASEGHIVATGNGVIETVEDPYSGLIPPIQ